MEMLNARHTDDTTFAVGTFDELTNRGFTMLVEDEWTTGFSSKTNSYTWKKRKAYKDLDNFIYWRFPVRITPKRVTTMKFNCLTSMGKFFKQNGIKIGEVKVLFFNLSDKRGFICLYYDKADLYPFLTENDFGMPIPVDSYYTIKHAVAMGVASKDKEYGKDKKLLDVWVEGYTPSEQVDNNLFELLRILEGRHSPLESKATIMVRLKFLNMLLNQKGIK